MRRDEVFESKYLKGADLSGGTVVVTIAKVEMLDISLEDAPEDLKPVVSFVGKAKTMILNVTNWQLLEVFLGSDDSDEWAGQSVILWNDPTIMFKKQMVGGLRFKGRAGEVVNPTPPPPDPSGDDIPF